MTAFSIEQPFAGDGGMTGDGRFRSVGKGERAAKPRMTRIDPIRTFGTTST
jgi:hypothetical protein